MGRIIMAILAFALVFAVFKMIIIALVLAGLIFRTKETICLLIFGGLWHLLAAYPAAGFALIGLFIVMAIVKACKKDSSTPPVALLEDHSE